MSSIEIYTCTLGKLFRSVLKVEVTLCVNRGLYLVHVQQMSAAFARAGTHEAAGRKLAIKTGWRCAGRSCTPPAVSRTSGLRSVASIHLQCTT